MSPKKFAAACAAAVLAVLGFAGVASAHVVVTASNAAPGAYTVLTFRVPTESEKASTTKLTISLPTDTPLLSVRYQPVPGWKAELKTETLTTPVKTDDATVTEAITQVTFTADSDIDGIPPGAFAQFSLSVGPLPEVAALSFPAQQTYSDGTVVDWNQPTPASGEEPEHPAPTLALGTAAASGDHHGGATGGATVSAAAGSTGTAVIDTTDTTARITAIGALVVAAFSVLLAAISVRRKSIPVADTPDERATTEPAESSAARRRNTEPKK